MCVMYRVIRLIFLSNISFASLFGQIWNKTNPKKKTSGCSPLSFLFRVLQIFLQIFSNVFLSSERREKENHMCFSHHPRLALFCISLSLLFLRILGVGRIKVTRQRNDFDESAEKTDWGERCVGFDREERRCLF